jgi:hypothetical protein
MFEAVVNTRRLPVSREHINNPTEPREASRVVHQIADSYPHMVQ